MLCEKRMCSVTSKDLRPVTVDHQDLFRVQYCIGGTEMVGFERRNLYVFLYSRLIASE